MIDARLERASGAVDCGVLHTGDGHDLLGRAGAEGQRQIGGAAFCWRAFMDGLGARIGHHLQDASEVGIERL
jgi:hypothetical protein